MKACILRSPARIETNPLEFTEIPKPEPAAGQVLVRVNACAVCRTDLHVIEGELAPRKFPITPGHQVVGIVEAAGSGAKLHSIGTRVGIAWLHSTDGTCEYCKAGQENLCDHPSFTGYTVDGGYAEYALAEESFVYPIPEGFRRSSRPRPCYAPESSASAPCASGMWNAADGWDCTVSARPRT